MKTSQLITLSLTLTIAYAPLQAGPVAKVSSPSERAQLVAQAQKISELSPQITAEFINPFLARPDPNADNSAKDTAVITDTDQIGGMIVEALNPTGVLKFGDNSFLQFAGSNPLKAGDTYTINIGKAQHIIQITRIGNVDFDFVFQGKTFSRPIKIK